MCFDYTGNYILLPTIINKKAPALDAPVYFATAKGESQGKVYKYKIATNSISKKTKITTGSQKLKASDLKIDITLLTDGGYAVSSTKQALLLPDGGNTCYNGLTTIYDKEYWETDAYVARYDVGDNKLWEATYPVVTFPVIPTSCIITDPNYFPTMDIKHQECIFAITHNQNNEIVIAGKTSHNFDDDLALKLYNECNVLTTFDIQDDDAITNDNIISPPTPITWNTPKKIRGVIKVESGGVLTITGSSTVIEFADTKAVNHPTYILVKRGGKLILTDGAKLTGLVISCGTMWDGVFVEGTNGTAQPNLSDVLAGTPTLTFGIVMMNSGGGILKPTIENARVGIKAKSPDPLKYPNFDGGIILCDGGKFYDNTIDIYFGAFNKNNISVIRRCEMKTNNLLKDNEEILDAHIYMEQMKKGIQIRGNYFENTTTTAVYPFSKRGYGIRSALSAYTCNDNPNAIGATGGTGTDPNTFKSLYYGINSTQPVLAGYGNIVVDGNAFENNKQGVYLGGTQLCEANRNLFTIYLGNIYGLYIDGGTGYGIEENTFNGPYSNAPSAPKGLIINNTGAANNIVYRNNFNGLGYGIQAQGVNANLITGATGLVFKCNNFADNVYDIAVTSGAIKTNQGDYVPFDLDPTKPAGNLFSNNLVTSLDQYHANAGVTPFNYNHHLDINAAASPFYEPYLYTSSIITLQECDPNFNIATTCITNFLTGGGGGDEYRIAGNTIKKYLNFFNNNNNYNNNPSNAKLIDDDMIDSLTEFEADILRNSIVSYYLNDDDQDSIIIALENDSSAFAQSILSSIAADNGNYTMAEDLVVNIEEDTDAEAEGYSADIFNIAIDLEIDSTTWNQMNYDQIATISNISEQEDREGIICKLILEYVNDSNYIEPIEDIIEEDTIIERFAAETSTGAYMKVYPHPVKEESTVEINIPGNEQTTLIIMDLYGRKIKEYLLTQEINYIKINNSVLQPGFYIGYILLPNKNKLSQKIIVIK